MPILTFRVSVPSGTTAKNPLTHDLISGASAIQSIMIWSPSAAIDKSGYRLANRLGTEIIPDAGSHDNFTFGNGEDGWAAIPTTPKQLPMYDQIIEGPPHTLRLKFYNVDAAAILVAGFIVVREPMAKLAEEAMIYEFLSAKRPTDTDISPETRTPLSSKKKSKVDMSGARVDVEKFLGPKHHEAKEHITGK